LLQASKFPNRKKIYTEKGKNRSFKLQFINDTLCLFTNEFHCKCLNPDIRIIKQTCLYRIKDDTLFIKNILYIKGDEQRFTFDIPIQDCLPCWFLNEKSRFGKREPNVMVIGPNYSSDYEKYGRIIKFNIDTLQIINNQYVFYYKKISTGSIGATFK